MARWNRRRVCLGADPDRYQQYNERTERYDKYDGDDNYLDSKSSPGKFKGVETREPKKPPQLTRWQYGRIVRMIDRFVAG